MKFVLIVIVAYLLGSFCASVPLSKRSFGGDVREKGSGNAGATNMARVYGMKAGLLTLAVDAAKTVAAMLFGYWLAGDVGKAVAGAACITGHCFPVYFNFKGGKGVSVGAAVGLMTSPWVFLIIAAVFFTVALIWRKISLASICAAASLPIAALIVHAPTPMVIMCVFCAVLVIFMHRGNIKRLINGTEPDFRAGKGKEK